MKNTNGGIALRKRRFSLLSSGDRWITIAMLGLVIFGSLMIISTQVGMTSNSATYIITAIIKQVAFVVAAFVLYFVVQKFFKFKLIEDVQAGLVLFGVGAMIVPLFMQGQGGSNAWIYIGPISIQPSEFVKPLIIMIVATRFYKAKKNPKLLQKPRELYKWPNIVLLIFSALLVIQRDLGTLVIILMIYIIMFLVPNYPNLERMQRRLVNLMAIGLVAGVLLFYVTDIGETILAQTPFSHIATRIANAKNPYLDVYGEGYQPANALYGIGNANFFGRGFGQSARKFGYLTQADSDYILAIVIEELGIFGFTFIVLGYGLLLSRLFYFAKKTHDTSYRLILIGTAAYLFMHFVLNVGGVSCLIPLTGVPLLFISNGGSSLMAISIALGLCQYCIARIRRKEMA